MPHATLCWSPGEPGAQGGSAWLRLSRCFHEKQNNVLCLGTEEAWEPCLYSGSKALMGKSEMLRSNHLLAAETFLLV